MGLANRDASQITVKKQQKMLFAWKNAQNTLVRAGGSSVLQEQPTFQSGSVVLMRRQGGCKCAADASTSPYEFNGIGGCGCGK